MAHKRTKKRTQKPPPPGTGQKPGGSGEPKSMVIRIGAGEVGPSVSQLVKDVRRMMEPGTASRLRERRSNKLRDYTSMAGPLGVSHLLLFSRSAMGNTNLRLALTPRGPTLHFKVERYSLCKDVRKSLKHAKGGGKEYQTAPLLVMNNFQTTQPIADDNTKPAIPKHLESLTTSIFQSLFPPISPQNTPLTSIRRVMLLNRELPSGDNKSNPDDGSYILNLRHYAITTKRTGMSKSLRRLNAAEKLIKDKKNKKAMPNLGKLQDVSDYILDPSAAAGGFTSGSESEAETDAEVEVLENQTRQVLSRKKLEKMRKREQEQARSGPPVEKRAVKMVELGPRLKLRMTKVEEGVCGGKVMWHEFVNRTKAEEKELDERWDVRRKEKEERKRIQRENVERKRKERGEDVNEGEQDEEMDDDEDAWDSEDVENDDEEDEDEDEMDVDGPGKAKSG